MLQIKWAYKKKNNSGFFCLLNRYPSLWSIITKCKEQIGKQNLNGKEDMKDSELLEPVAPVCNLKDGQIISELQSVENTATPVCEMLQTGQRKEENSSQGRGTVQHKASEVKTSIRKGQLFAYVFSPGTESWEIEQLERAPPGQNISLPEPRLSSLAHSLQGVIMTSVIFKQAS
jgi:hypothetical protein